MNVCIVFNSKYFKPEAGVSQTIGRDTQQVATRLWTQWHVFKAI